MIKREKLEKRMRGTRRWIEKMSFHEKRLSVKTSPPYMTQAEINEQLTRLRYAD